MRSDGGIRGFSAGFRQRSPLVLVAAALLAGVALLGLQCFITSGAWTVVPLEYWLSSSNDPFTYVTWHTTRLKREPPEKPLLAMVGGSSAREAIWNGESLAAEIRRLGGPDVRGQSLAGMNQTLGGSAAVIDNLPHTPTTVLLGVSLLRMYDMPETLMEQVGGEEYGLHGESLKEFAARRGRRSWLGMAILPGVARALATRLNRLSEDIATGKPLTRRYNEHPMDGNLPLTAAKREKIFGWANGSWASERLRRQIDSTLELMDLILRNADARGLRVVLLELPHNPAFIEAGYRETASCYQTRLKELARKHDAIFLDFNEQLPLQDADFIDFSHLRPSGRSIWQAGLARELTCLYRSGAISGERPAAPAP